MITLVLEASTYAGSVALIDGSAVLAERAVAMRGREHEALMPAVAEVLEAAGINVSGIARVVCGAGPGSFTSLRIAGAIAKGIALAASVPLVPVSSLALLVASREPQAPGRFLAVVDAMRGERYVQALAADSAGEMTIEGALHILPASEVAAMAHALGATVLGPGESGELQVLPRASAAARITNMISSIDAAVLEAWEPGYGRLAEAQVKWEADHGRPLQQG